MVHGSALLRVPGLLVATLPFFLAPASGGLFAQDAYPSKPIRLILTMPAGSGSDVIVRKAGPDLAARMGQPWVVENRPGANSIIVGEACARAAPDGYTVCNGNFDMMSNNPHIFSKLPYDPDKDLKAVTNMFFLTEGLFTKTALPVRSVAELKALATAKSGALNLGTFGPHSNPDLFRQWMSGHWNTDIVGIPYKGGNLIIAALAAGEIDIAKIGAYNAIPQMQAKKVNLLAVTSDKRLRLHPDVPTMAEVGLDGYAIKGWQGLVAPGGTPDAIVRRISSEFVRLFNESAFAAFLETQYVEIAVSAPEEFAAFLKEDRARAAQVVRQFNIPRQ